MPKLVLVRHGQTDYNLQKRFCGFTDVSINAQGREDALQVVQALQELGIAFQAGYTSWLKRAWETLDILLPELDQTDLPITKHPFLNERHYGDLQGRLHEDLRQEYSAEQVQLWRRSYAVRPPNGESLQDVVHRVEYYLDNEIMPHIKAGENVLVCAHGNTNRAIVKIVEGVTDQEIVKREIAYSEPIIYNF